MNVKTLIILLSTILVISACKTKEKAVIEHDRFTLTNTEKKNIFLESIVDQIGLSEKKEKAFLASYAKYDQMRMDVRENEEDRYIIRSKMIEIGNQQKAEFQELLTKKEYKKYEEAVQNLAKN